MTTRPHITTVRAVPIDLDAVRAARGQSKPAKTEPAAAIVRLPQGMIEIINDDGVSPLTLIDGIIPRDLALLLMRVAAAYPGAKAE